MDTSHTPITVRIDGPRVYVNDVLCAEVTGGTPHTRADLEQRLDHDRVNAWLRLAIAKLIHMFAGEPDRDKIAAAGAALALGLADHTDPHPMPGVPPVPAGLVEKVAALTPIEAVQAQELWQHGRYMRVHVLSTPLDSDTDHG